MKKIEVLKLAVISSIIGLVTGGVIGLFLSLLEKFIDLNLTYDWLIFILPISGVLMTFLYNNFGKNSHKGNNLIIENINGSKEEINFIMAPLVFLGTLLTHLFGGSVGREGTGVQIGGTIGNLLVKWFKNNDNEKEILLISGVAAGFSSIFGTPITGTIFAVGVANIGVMNFNSMLPAIISVMVGDKVVRLLGITHGHYKVLLVEDISIINIEKVIILAISFGVVSRLFVYMTKWFKSNLNKYFKNPYIKIFIGGSIMVIVTLFLGNRTYNNLSLGLINDAFLGKTPYFAFIIKLLLTTLCLGAGYQGGEVTPLFVIGATLGASLSPLLGLPLVFSVALGFVGVFAGATNSPIASLMMYLELFGSVNIVFALLVCIISVFVSGNKGIYTSQLWFE